MAVLERAVAAISLWMARAGGFLLVLASALISFEILGRKFFSLPFSIGNELSGYALAIGASWSFSYALLHRAHVRVDVLRGRFPPVGRTFLDVLALISLAAMALVLVVPAWGTFETSLQLGARENTPLGTPLIVPQGLWLAGLVWFAAVCIEQCVLVLMALLRGESQTVQRLAAPVSAEASEVEEALAKAEARPQGVL
jgi:TRAP-type mannitol/chloroaromatic compound transport system permease small subunit